MSESKDFRVLTLHHDGFTLNNAIQLQANPEGPGGASHLYVAQIDGVEVTRIQFQCGGRNEEGSVSGVTDRVLLAIVLDRMLCFNKGKFGSRLNALAATAIEQAMLWLHARTMERASRGVLGKAQA